MPLSLDVVVWLRKCQWHHPDFKSPIRWPRWVCEQFRRLKTESVLPNVMFLFFFMYIVINRMLHRFLDHVLFMLSYLLWWTKHTQTSMAHMSEGHKHVIIILSCLESVTKVGYSLDVLIPIMIYNLTRELWISGFTQSGLNFWLIIQANKQHMKICLKQSPAFYFR